MSSENRHQLELLERQRERPNGPHVEPVTPQLIAAVRRRQTFLAAWNFAQDFACLDDKACYGPLAMDSSHWTKIRKGHASPPGDRRMTQYLDVVQNEFPLIWLAEARGYDWTTIRRHQSDKDREIEELKQENRDLRRSMALWAEAHTSAPQRRSQIGGVK